MHVYENKPRPLDVSFLAIVRLIAASCKYVFLFKEIQIMFTTYSPYLKQNSAYIKYLTR